MKACYDHLANLAGFQEGDRVWLYCPIWKRGKSPKLQTRWEGSYIITQINVIYWIQWHPRTKMMVIQLDRLAPYVGGPKSNWTLNLARELEVDVRCATRCCGSTQYSSSLPRGVNL